LGKEKTHKSTLLKGGGGTGIWDFKSPNLVSLSSRKFGGESPLGHGGGWRRNSKKKGGKVRNEIKGESGGEEGGQSKKRGFWEKHKTIIEKTQKKNGGKDEKRVWGGKKRAGFGLHEGQVQKSMNLKKKRKSEP